MATKIDELIAEARAETTVIQSVVALLAGLSARLAAAGTDQQKLDELKQVIDTNRSALAQAVLENTLTPPSEGGGDGSDTGSGVPSGGGGGSSDASGDTGGGAKSSTDGASNSDNVPESQAA